MSYEEHRDVILGPIPPVDPKLKELLKKEPVAYVEDKPTQFLVAGEKKSILPESAAERKKIPIGTGVLDYFPAALAAVAAVSFAGNEQHNPGQELHWSRGKSGDQADTLIRHFLERGTLDVDGHRHSAKLAWRALAILQLELEAEGAPIARGAK
jgi:hypothetical protein